MDHLVGSNPPPPMFIEGRGRDGRLDDHTPPALTEGPGEADPAGSSPGMLRAFILALISSVFELILAGGLEGLN